MTTTRPADLNDRWKHNLKIQMEWKEHSLGSSVWFIIVSILWGATNPLIKKSSAGIENIKRDNPVLQVLAEIRFLALNWKYVVPFLLNQSGSVLFYLTLASADLSLAVPITNALTFIVTILSGKLLGEENLSFETYVGMILVMCGVSLCVIDKS